MVRMVKSILRDVDVGAIQLVACYLGEPETLYIYLGLKLENILEYTWLKSKETIMKDMISGVCDAVLDTSRDKDFKETIDCLGTI